MALQRPLKLAGLEVPNLDGGVLGGRHHHAEDGMKDHSIHCRAVACELELLGMPRDPFGWGSLRFRGRALDQLFLSLTQF